MRVHFIGRVIQRVIAIEAQMNQDPDTAATTSAQHRPWDTRDDMGIDIDIDIDVDVDTQPRENSAEQIGIDFDHVVFAPKANLTCCRS